MEEQFIVLLNLEGKRIISDKMFIDELDERKIDNLFNSKYKETLEFLSGSPYHYETFLHTHLLKWQKVSFHLDRGEQFKIPPDVFERSEQIIFYFLSDLFITLNDIAINRVDFNYEHPTNLPGVFISNLNLEKIFEYIQSNEFMNKDMFLLYYYSYLMNQHSENESYFFKLKELIEKNLDKLSKFGKMNFILRLISYCNMKIKRYNDRKFSKIKLELYDIYLKFELYKVNINYFRTDVFINLFNSYLENRLLSRASAFLEENIKSINPAHVNNLTRLCKAQLLFESGKIRESLSIASTIKTNASHIKVGLRKLLLKLDYELNSFDENMGMMNNFRHFVIGNKSLGELPKKNLMIFLKSYGELIKLKEKCNDDYLLSQLRKEIECISDPLDKNWFTKKVNSYQSKTFCKSDL